MKANWQTASASQPCPICETMRLAKENDDMRALLRDIIEVYDKRPNELVSWPIEKAREMVASRCRYKDADGIGP